MKTFEFQDKHGIEIAVQHSSAAEESYRIYLKDPNVTTTTDKMGNEIPQCIHLSRRQAEIFVASLEDLMEDNG